MDTLRRFAWLFGLIGGALVLLFLAARFALGQADTPWMVTGGVGAAFLVAFLFLDREEIGEVASTRAARYGTGALLSVALALGVVVAANVLGVRYDKRWDWTASGAHTLSAQSVELAAALKEPVQVIGFFATGTVEEAMFKGLIEAYQEHTDDLELTLVDPIQEPLMAQEYTITSAYGTVVLVQGESRQRLETAFDEEAFTNALIRLTANAEHTVCFTKGHGEREVDDETTLDGIGGVVLKMEDLNYTAKPFMPLSEGRVPEDCEVVVLVGPQVELLAPEREILAAYVAGGGALFALLDPTFADGFAGDLARYGVKVGNDLVLEDNPNYQLEGGDPSYIILGKESLDFHPIVEDIRSIALMRIVRSVGEVEGFEGANVQVLARTSPNAWAETNLTATAAPTPDPDEIVGEVPVMAVSEITDPSVLTIGPRTLERSTLPELGSPEAATEGEALSEGEAPATEEPPASEPPATEPPAAAPEPARKAGGRVVVFGDSDFVSNQFLVQGNNQDLFLNTIAWLVGEEDQISIRSNEAGAGTLTVSVLQAALVALISLILVPGLAAAAAVGTWMRRRRL
ncbi:MAG: GldG family protein [Alphaproteobacteria bacterium]|nr:GldG family protein [Alphaproteobacteria bacterium]MCB9792364.1 GldG family protein [Alphaproteobacteria bacterium]